MIGDPTDRNALDVTVRRARLADAAEIVRLLAQLHPRYPGDPASATVTLQSILGMPGRFLLVAERAGAMVGTADVLIVPNLTHAGRPWAIVENVVVDERARGSGVGTALLDGTFELARETGCYMLQLLSLNHRAEAHAFYRRLGFAPLAAGFRLYLEGFAPTTEADGAAGAYERSDAFDTAN
jgi:GNAT superfamily N-acetyltransferase